MRKKTLVLLGVVLGAISPVLLQPLALSLALVIILIPVSVVLIVIVALLNQEVFNRLIQLITAILSHNKPKALTKRN